MEKFLKETLSCLPKAEVIIVSPEAQKWFLDEAYDQVYWLEFIDQVDDLLKNQFYCSEFFEVLRCLNKTDSR